MVPKGGVDVCEIGATFVRVPGSPLRDPTCGIGDAVWTGGGPDANGSASRGGARADDSAAERVRSVRRDFLSLG